MTEPHRKLAAIMNADVVGYSRLMAHDEAATVATLQEYRAAMNRVIARHKGRVVNAPGDNILAEFPSAVEAVHAAVEIQQSIEGRNVELPEERRMPFRVGVNLGDVIEEADGTIYGDGVNIAARMEALAESGGICISSAVYDAVQGKIAFGFEFLGEQQVKNIDRPIPVYRVRSEPRAPSAAPATPAAPASRRSVLIAAAGVVLLVVAGLAVWHGTRAPSPPPHQVADVPAEPEDPLTEMTSEDTVPPLDPHRIAVLPFVNISRDPADEYFADGMTEELLSTLSRIGDLRVIARTSVMAYKSTEKKVDEIGRELKVGTILEGSVRKAADKLRISVQLIDVASQEHRWSQDYDRDLQDVFAIQSDIATQVAEALQVTLLAGEQEQLATQRTANLEAYQAYLKGRYFWNKREKWLKNAIASFEQALDHDPTYARAHAGVAAAYGLFPIYGLATSPREVREVYARARAAATQALTLDETLAEAYTVLAWIRLSYDWDWAGAERAFQRALALDPSYATAHQWYAIYLRAMGRHTEAIAAMQRAHELDPLSLIINTGVGFTFLKARQYDQAIAQFKQTLEMAPHFTMALWGLGVAYRQQGRYEDAIAASQKVIDLTGGWWGAVAYLGLTYAVSGQTDQARQLRDALHARAAQESISPLAFAWLSIGLGETDQAFAWLDKAYEERATFLYELKAEHLYDPLRSDPRFTKLLQKMGFPTD